MSKNKKIEKSENRVGGWVLILLVVFVLAVTVFIFLGLNAKLGLNEAPGALPGQEDSDVLPSEQHPVSDVKTAMVYFINVGQGDCELIVSDDGSAMLIDAGEQEYGKGVVSFIKDLGITRLDYVVGTHPHSDHIGGLRHILKSDLEIGVVITPVIPDEYMPTTYNYEKFINAIAANGCEVRDVENESFAFGSGTITIMKPDYAEDNYNNYSPLIMFEYGKTSFLFTGDAEKLVEYQMIERDEYLDADVLKVGHHGSITSSSVDFLNAVTPEWCIIECGDNEYNHPNPNIVTRLSEYTENIYRTDRQGTIEFICDLENYEVKTEVGPDVEKADN